MNTAASSDPCIHDVRVTEQEIIAYLEDGRIISVPIAWSWRLSEATPAQRANFRLIGSGQGVHWPDIDEDISVEGMLHGVPARHPRPTVTAKGRTARGHAAPEKLLKPAIVREPRPSYRAKRRGRGSTAGRYAV